MIPYDEARALIVDAVSVLSPIETPLEEAAGCVSAQTVLAHEAVPGFDNSAMDGYALRSSDTASGAPLRVVAATLAGDTPGAPLGAGEAARIMTGAALPLGADCVCEVESTSEGPGPVVVIERDVKRGDNVRRAGEDIRVGDQLLSRGEEMTPVRVGVVASQGIARLLVHPRPRVGYLSTGSELQGPGLSLRPGAIRDSNRPLMASLVRTAGFVPVDLGTVHDEESAIRERLLAGADTCDAVVSTGGVSVGDADHVKSAILALGAPAYWMQLALRPAKPFAFGVFGEHETPVFGLPGNPVSARVAFELLVYPALRRRGGHRVLDRPVVSATLDEPLARRRDAKVHLVHVHAHFGDDGRLHVAKAAPRGSHLLRAAAYSNALAFLLDGDGLAVGEEVPVILLEVPSREA